MIIWWEDPDGKITPVEVHWSVPFFCFLGLVLSVLAGCYLLGMILGAA